MTLNIAFQLADKAEPIFQEFLVNQAETNDSLELRLFQRLYESAEIHKNGDLLCRGWDLPLHSANVLMAFFLEAQQFALNRNFSINCTANRQCITYSIS